MDTLVNVSLNATVCISSSHEKYRKYSTMPSEHFRWNFFILLGGKVGGGGGGGWRRVWGIKTNLMVKATHS